MKVGSIPRTSLEPVCDALAYVIQKHRKARKLSMNEMAQRTRLSRQMIAMVEKRRRVPTVDTVARICRAFGVSAGMVWFEAEERLGQARCNRGCNYSYITPCGRFVVISPPCRSR